MSREWSGGKGDLPRKYDRISWEKFWQRYCQFNGHRFVNGRCVYCGQSQNSGR